MTNKQPCDTNDITFLRNYKLPKAWIYAIIVAKRRDVAVILMGVILAILSNRDGNLSSVRRHMKNHYAQLLQELQLDNYHRQVVSRSHLPIVLSKVSWKVFNQLIFANFGVKLNKKHRKWFAIDGKEMRGSIKLP